MKDDITCVFEGVAGVGAIYISNIKAAQNKQLLKRLGIKAIVTAVKGGEVKHDKKDVTDHLFVPAYDIESYDLSKHFQQTYKFIDDVRRKTNVLVHCYAGISRSATLVIAYLLKKYNYSLSTIIMMVKRRRNKINPNRGFLQQLKQEAHKMNLPMDINQKQFAELLKPKTRYSSIEKRKSFSAQKASIRKAQQLGVTTKNFSPKIEQNFLNEKLMLRNIQNNEGESTLRKTHNGTSKQPKQINQNEQKTRDNAESKQKNSKFIQAEINFSQTLQRYSKSCKKIKCDDISIKIQRIKSKMLQSNGRIKKRTHSQLGSPNFSTTIYSKKGLLSDTLTPQCLKHSCFLGEKEQVKPEMFNNISVNHNTKKLGAKDQLFNNNF